MTQINVRIRIAYCGLPRKFLSTKLYDKQLVLKETLKEPTGDKHSIQNYPSSLQSISYLLDTLNVSVN